MGIGIKCMLTIKPKNMPKISTQQSRSAFTLVELLVVIAVIGLLATIVAVSVNNARTKSRDVKRIADLKQIQTALELFYDNYNRYPITAGAPTWDGHWQNFATCLETGVGCGFTISGYQAPITKVPQDPKDDPATLSDADPTYYFSYNGCTDQEYVLRVLLETNHSALGSDADGNYYTAGDNGCTDPWYCLKQNWCR